MNKEQVIALLEQLDIQPHRNAWHYEGRLIDILGFNKFTLEQGASKNCLVFRNEPFVVKWSIEPSPFAESDEAMKEVAIYQRAVEAGVEKFFPATAFLCKIGKVRFIIQSKVDYSVASMPYALLKKWEGKYKNTSPRITAKVQKCMNKAAHGHYARTMSHVWMASALTIYGKRAVKEFCEFVIEERINDLHESNVGFLNGKPVLIDFCGYWG